MSIARYGAKAARSHASTADASEQTAEKHSRSSQRSISVAVWDCAGPPSGSPAESAYGTVTALGRDAHSSVSGEQEPRHRNNGSLNYPSLCSTLATIALALISFPL